MSSLLASGYGLTAAQYEARKAQGEFQSYQEPTVLLSLEEAERRLYSGRSFSSILCKIWRFFVGVAEAIVDGLATVLKSISKAVVSVLSELFDAVSDAFGDWLEKPLFWIAAGLGLWWLMSSGEEEDSSVVLEQKGF